MSKHLETLGIGSSFNYTKESEFENYNFSKFIESYQLFYTGRHAIKHLLDTLEEQHLITTIWLPNYYCQQVTEWLKHVYKNIKTYSIDPFDIGSVFNDFTFASTNDVVILNNFWGTYLYAYSEQKNRPIIIEDHSHGWLSTACLNSKADYCFASLRKTIPMPLGGILWSPTGNKIKAKKNNTLKTNFQEVWDKITRAMQMKTDFLQGNEYINKKDYLDLINETETFLHHQHQDIPVEKTHLKIMEAYLHKDYNAYKKINLGYIIPKINPNPFFKLIASATHCSFGLELVFKDRGIFNELKTYLVQYSIYPSELWPENTINTNFKFLLNIHVDYRYTKVEMDHIANALNNWIIKKIYSNNYVQIFL